MLDLEQAKAYLQSVGVSLPDFLLEALLEQVNTATECLNANGVPLAQQTLILSYLLGLMGLAQGDRYVTSERAPSGAARSYRYLSMSERWRALLGLLRNLDKYGCTEPLIPPEPGAARAMLLSVRGGNCCE